MTEAIFKNLSQPNTIAILAVLYEKGPMKITALWQNVGSSYAAIKNICDRMNDYGLVKVTYTPPKYFDVALTEVGEEIGKRCVEIVKLYKEYYEKLEE